MKTKTLALILSAVLACSLFTACGGREKKDLSTAKSLADLSGAGGYDHIFCNPAFSAVAKGVEKNNCVQYASDHYPVWVDVTLRKGQE